MSNVPPHRREPYRIPSPPTDWVRLAGWIICALGGALFAASFVASTAGVVILPFDKHHIVGQLGGLFIAYGGVRIATGRHSRRGNNRGSEPPR